MLSLLLPAAVLCLILFTLKCRIYIEYLCGDEGCINLKYLFLKFNLYPREKTKTQHLIGVDINPETITGLTTSRLDIKRVHLGVYTGDPYTTVMSLVYIPRLLQLLYIAASELVARATADDIYVYPCFDQGRTRLDAHITFSCTVFDLLRNKFISLKILNNK